MARTKSNNNKKLIAALDILEQEKGISKQIILDALKEALEKSYKKNTSGSESIIEAKIDDITGKVEMFRTQIVVYDVNDEDFELSEEEANEMYPGHNYQVGDEIVTQVDIDEVGRLVALQTKQILRQKIREAEKEALYNEYVGKKDDIITGEVDRVEDRFAIINIGKASALLPVNAQIPGEVIKEGQRIKVYLSEVEKNTKGTHIGVSRTKSGLVKRLFESEVPEIYDGTVEIKSVSREPGERSKIAVYTDNIDIDPIGSCVGKNGTRVRNVVNELNGEMVDIIEWSSNPVIYISNALSPAKVSHVKLTQNEDENAALVVVPDNQLSLAIGKRGQNARLAVRLTGWKIDIKSESEIAELGIDISEDDNFNEEFLQAMEEEVSNDPIDVVEEFDNDEVVEEVKTVENKQPVEENKETKEEQPLFTFDFDALRESAQEEDTDYVKVFTADDDVEDDYDDDYDPKYDEDIDYDAYDEYYD